MYNFYPLALLLGALVYFWLNAFDQDSELKTANVRKNLQAGPSTGGTTNRGVLPGTSSQECGSPQSKARITFLVGLYDQKVP